METELSNIVTALGEYNNIPTSISSEAAIVTMITGLTIEKVADKTVWADGLLTYTITVKNETTQTYTNATVTDILNTTLIDFVDDSVTIDSTKATSEEYTYTAETGTLTVKLSDIAPSTTKTITFQVKKKA